MTVLHEAPPSPGKRDDGSQQNDEGERPLKLRPPRLEDGDAEAMWRLARESGVLEENAEYTYHMFSHFFTESCVIAELDGEPAGFIAGLRTPEQPDTVFVWQIAVDQKARGRGVAAAMLRGLIERLTGDVRYLEATVTPTNEASERTFRKVARELGVECTTSVLFPGHRFAGPSHEDEVLFKIGPLPGSDRDETTDQQSAREGAAVPSMAGTI